MWKTTRVKFTGKVLIKKQISGGSCAETQSDQIFMYFVKYWNPRWWETETSITLCASSLIYVCLGDAQNYLGRFKICALTVSFINKTVA